MQRGELVPLVCCRLFDRISFFPPCWFSPVFAFFDGPKRSLGKWPLDVVEFALNSKLEIEKFERRLCNGAGNWKSPSDISDSVHL
jgi:hypothetical protein